MRIREANEGDYTAIIDIQKGQKLAWPERAGSVDALKVADAARNPRFLLRRWIAETDDGAVGFVSASEMATYNSRRAFAMNIAVREGQRGQGIGTALFSSMQAWLGGIGDGVLSADGYTLYPGDMGFLEGLGFRETWRETPVELDVAACDTGRLSELEALLKRQDVTILSLRELEDDPDRDRRLHELYSRLASQVPSEEGYVYEKPSFEDWHSEQIEDPSTLHDAYLVARHGAEYIGLKEVGMMPGSKSMQCGLMAVLPVWQRRGIARAMQLKTIDYAKRIGCGRLKSCTATSNAPMQNLYAALGYVKILEWVQYLRAIRG